MEQTLNTFTSGLQMDTYPMQQGQDSLTDALNATFITMNGNEIALQNDMGNAQINSAYLPKGYMPVGMKEYGGVIYVAAYNPITDRGQIGSFPSPQRRFGDANDNQCEFNPSAFLDEDENSISIIKRTLLLPLTKENLFRAGDKFVLYFGENSDSGLKNYLSNRNNTTGDLITSPKNNYFTLSLGVMNSKNEFVDITKDLLRFDDKGKVIEFDESKSDEYKFNSGYFISDTIDNLDTNSLTNADSELAKIRKLDTLDLNTYSYKLVGQPYIKAELNAPTDFEYSISGYSNNITIIYSREPYDRFEQGDIVENNIVYYCFKLQYLNEYVYITDLNDLQPTIYDSEFKELGNGEFQDFLYNLKVTSLIKYNCPDGYEQLNTTYKIFSYEREKYLIDENKEKYQYISNLNFESGDVGGIRCLAYMNSKYNIILVDDVQSEENGSYTSYYIQDGEQYAYNHQQPDFINLNNYDQFGFINLADLTNSYSDLSYLSVNFNNLNPISTTKTIPEYNSVNNIYIIKIVQEFVLNEKQNMYNYTITPTIQKWDDRDTNLKILDLQRTGTIDLSQLATGKMELTNWRFYNDTTEKQTSITYGFQSYPKEGQEFKNLKFDFYEVNDDLDSSDDADKVDSNLNKLIWIKSFTPNNTELGLNGVFDDVIDWEDVDTPQYLTLDNKVYKIVSESSDESSDTSLVTVYLKSSSIKNYEYGTDILVNDVSNKVNLFNCWQVCLDGTEIFTDNNEYSIGNNLKLCKVENTISRGKSSSTSYNIQLIFDDSDDSSDDSSDDDITSIKVEDYDIIISGIYKHITNFYNKSIPSIIDDNTNISNYTIKVLNIKSSPIPIKVYLQDCLKYVSNDDKAIYYNSSYNIYFKENNNAYYQTETPKLIKYVMESNKMYQVKISWDSFVNGTYELSDYDLRWLLTTRLFNESYFQTSEKYIKDFCNPDSQNEMEVNTYESLVTVTPNLIVSDSTEILKSEESLIVDDSSNNVFLKLDDDSTNITINPYNKLSYSNGYSEPQISYISSLTPKIDYIYRQTYNVTLDCGKAGLPGNPFLQITYPTIYTVDNNKSEENGREAERLGEDQYVIRVVGKGDGKSIFPIGLTIEEGGPMYNYQLKSIQNVFNTIPYMSMGIAMNNKGGDPTKFYVNLYQSSDYNIKLLHGHNGRKSSKNYMNPHTDYTYVKDVPKTQIYYLCDTKYDDPRTAMFSKVKGGLFSEFNQTSSNGLILGMFSFGYQGANVRPLSWVRQDDSTDSWVAIKSQNSLQNLINNLKVPVEAAQQESGTWWYFNTKDEDVSYEIDISHTINIYTGQNNEST